LAAPRPWQLEVVVGNVLRPNDLGAGVRFVAMLAQRDVLAVGYRIEDFSDCRHWR
jgi:hypothetical protein